MGGRVARQQNSAVLARLGCAACPLNNAPIKTPKMEPTLVPGALIYVMAEAPGRDEDENTGKPLTGPSGALLRECIPNGHKSSYDNVCNCRPPQNRTPVWQEIECCSPRRIKYINQAKPKLILGLGAIPCSWALGTTDIAGMRGKLFAIKVGDHACWFMPTYHPSYILRLAKNKKKPLNSMFGHCFRMDVAKAFAVVERLHPPDIEEESDVRLGVACYQGTAGSDAPVLGALLDRVRKAPLKSIDLETKGLRPYSSGANVLSVSFSTDDTNVAFALNHPQSGWSQDQRKKLIQVVKEIISDDTIKIAHNAIFEQEWLAWLCGVDAIRHDVWEDTQMQAHFLDERKSKQGDDDTPNRYLSLDFLVKQHFGINFKKCFKLNKKDMSQNDLPEVLVYNGADTRFTLKLWQVQDKLLKQEGLYDAYIDALPRQASCALIQGVGLDVAQTVVRAGQCALEVVIDSLRDEINRQPVVQQYLKDKREFNPLSNNDVVSIFRDYLKRPEVTIQDGDKVRYSTDKNVLDKIDHPLSGLLIQLRNRQKLKSTYLDSLEVGKGELIYPDGKMHPSFNTCQTETGRTSSSDPNAQNWPKRTDSWVRRCVIPPPGHIMVAIDYGQLEACTGAMCTQDQFLVKALWEDYDTHMEWAERIAHKAPQLVGGKSNIADKAVMKKFRSVVKNKWTFPNFFGANPQSVRGYLINATGEDVSQQDIDDLIDDFWSTFAGFKHWQDRLMKEYYNTGYVSTLVGRKHRYPLRREQAINAPIQGTAAELVCDAMNRLSMKALKTGKYYLHPVLNVHDDLSFFMPDDDKILDAAISEITHEMLKFTYSWVNVPLSCEVSIGQNWCDLEPLDKIWSHKTHGYPKAPKGGSSGMQSAS